MGDVEKKVLLKLMKDMKEVKENVLYLVEATELLLQIQTQAVKDGQSKRR